MPNHCTRKLHEAIPPFTLESDGVCEVPPSKRERDLMIRDLIATQALAGFNLSLDDASAIVDEAFAAPMPHVVQQRE